MLSLVDILLVLLEVGILVAILVEIVLGWLWHQEDRRWHAEEMAQWRQENGGKTKESGN